MYIEKEVKRGYNEYTLIEVNNGEGTFMDIALLVMEDGDEFRFDEKDKEVSWLMIEGHAAAIFDGQIIEMDRPNPFTCNPYCMLLPAGKSCSLKAYKHCEIYVQKTLNDQSFPVHLYTPDEVDTWRRGAEGELDGMMERDVRTCFDYDSAPYSNMVLGEVINLPGKWSSYPPHYHPQPEVYFYHFERPEGFGAGWSGGEVHEIHHNGCCIITDSSTHSQVMAPGYPCCYMWGIRHLPGNPWIKTRIDDPTFAWLLEKNPTYWNGK